MAANSTRPARLSCSPTWRARSTASRRLGAKDFYEGETARLLAKDMEEHGGLITDRGSEGLQGHRAQAADRLVPRLLDHRRAAAQFRRRRRSADARHAGRDRVRERRRRVRHRGPLHDRGDAPLLRRPLGAPRRSRFREGAAQQHARSRSTCERCARESTPSAPRLRARSMPPGSRRRSRTRPRITRWPTRRATSPS